MPEDHDNDQGSRIIVAGSIKDIHNGWQSSAFIYERIVKKRRLAHHDSSKWLVRKKMTCKATKKIMMKLGDSMSTTTPKKERSTPSYARIPGRLAKWRNGQTGISIWKYKKYGTYRDEDGNVITSEEDVTSSSSTNERSSSLHSWKYSGSP